VDLEQDLLDLLEVDLLHHPIWTEDRQEGENLSWEVGFMVGI
jgi:hypothetical protein